MEEKRKRIHLLDEIRGFAILCMIVHHAFLDVGDVLHLNWGYKVFDVLCYVQPVFWAAFIIISGMCTRLSRSAVKRGILVLICGGVITLVTALIMPLFGFIECEIYFGILHCLGFCMIAAGLIMPLIKKMNYKAGAIVSAVLFLFFYGIDSGSLCFGLIDLPPAIQRNNLLAPLGLHNAAFYSADYFPVIPWIFMFFAGVFLGKPVSEGELPAYMYKKRSRLLSLAGKNSLWIYLAHQPVIYGIMMLINLVISE